MNSLQAIQSESDFMFKYIPVFLQRFGMEYYKEDFCIEFFVNERLSGSTISSSIVLSYNPSRDDLHVSRFHPELYMEPDSKYMSAVCFYLIIQHSSDLFSVHNACHISLETVPLVCDGFYKKLRDFNFHVNKYGLGNVVELESNICKYATDTSMIIEHIYGPGEIPFMK